MTEALLGFLAVTLLSVMRIPLTVTMTLVGAIGMGLMRGWGPSFSSVGQVVFETGFAYVLSVVPLFILMGNFIARAGMATDLFAAANAFIGHYRGGLGMATILASGGFGSVCGSSIATAATMARVSYPEMRKHNYSQALATGTIAAGGTLGILIPPSTIMVIYGIITETNIGELFIAGIMPGFVAIGFLCLAVMYVTWRDPHSGPRAEKSSWKVRFQSLLRVWEVVLLFILVMGGIYGGFFTATEGAGVGAVGSFLFALARRNISFQMIVDILEESARSTAMIFAILISAVIFSNFINFTTMPAELKEFVQQFSLHPLMVVVAMMVVYVVLGTIMEELSMILLTLPIFFPIVTSLGFDPVWFGILIVTIVEIGLISPPVGMNLFVINSLLKDVTLKTIFNGVTPFVIADIFRLAVLVAFPAISLWLPALMK